MSLPKFPNEKNLELDDYQSIIDITLSFLPYSDFNFTSLYVWDVDESIRISELNGNLVVRFRDYIDGSNFYSFIGKNDINDTCSQLMAHCKANGYGSTLRLVPEDVAHNISDSSFLCVEDRDNHDYVLDLDRTIKVSGSKNHQKKRRINKFARENPSAYVKPIGLKIGSTVEDILNIFESWATSKGQSLESEEVQSELEAIHRLVDASDNLSLFISGLYVHEKLCGFSISEFLNDQYAIGHFEKADRTMSGAFQYLQFEHAKNLKKQGVKYFNIEQDLGVEGLRISKMSYDPIRFLNKYTIETIGD